MHLDHVAAYLVVLSIFSIFKKLRLVLSRRDISEEKPAPPVIFCKFWFDKI